ncbi:hypothetical protein BRADI_2g39006v3 [Brachypodium distachyon]|uniref:Uncharacterized protein n=1 Tax=Brachypodium distachyon TaxID=15368 RepID=A0A2K2DCS3_BRADI|nr:hypothetical protein BRADI_2g39006v3 [Brachypodium distachyon]PNT72079.1 hypothetical protein BRADI_2g39006v3 [Brachypodium distachyon]PNT72080.1 hypothetical protein BRADI_2g39006v3 [Brachypodium distachyon]
MARADAVSAALRKATAIPASGSSHRRPSPAGSHRRTRAGGGGAGGDHTSHASPPRPQPPPASHSLFLAAIAMVLHDPRPPGLLDRSGERERERRGEGGGVKLGPIHHFSPPPEKSTTLLGRDAVTAAWRRPSRLDRTGVASPPVRSSAPAPDVASRCRSAHPRAWGDFSWIRLC